MVPLSPVDALGGHAQEARRLLIDVVQSVHDRFAEAHLVSGSRYAMAFGSQWRDLLADSHDAFSGRGFQSHKLLPGGYSLPVVNDCLLYVWRIPDSADPAAFASSQTKQNGFGAAPPDPMLIGPAFEIGSDSQLEAEASDEFEPSQVVRAVGGVMPLVLVIVRSSPWQLQSIEWGIAELDKATGKVMQHGRQPLWEPELVTEGAAHEATSHGDSFDQGPQERPVVRPREQESTDRDA